MDSSVLEFKANAVRGKLGLSRTAAISGGLIVQQTRNYKCLGYQGLTWKGFAIENVHWFFARLKQGFVSRWKSKSLLLFSKFWKTVSLFSWTSEAFDVKKSQSLEMNLIIFPRNEDGLTILSLLYVYWLYTHFTALTIHQKSWTLWVMKILFYVIVCSLSKVFNECSSKSDAYWSKCTPPNTISDSHTNLYLFEPNLT